MSDNLTLPVHIGIIMDGNGRWAKKRGLPRKLGHKKGAETFRETVRYCNKLGIKYLTVYAFSTENWKRPQDEIDSIMNLLRKYLSDAKYYVDENVKTKFIGDLSVLDDDLQQKIEISENETEDFTGLTLNIAVNYGGQDEIVNAVKQIATSVKEDNISIQDIDKAMIEQNLYTHGQPPIDLVIRPSGEQRLSNFLIWQTAYAEFVFLDVLWPDFNEKQLDIALNEFNKRNRRFGGV